MAKTKPVKRAKAPKRATARAPKAPKSKSKTKAAIVTYPGQEPGAPVFVCIEPGHYQLGVLMYYRDEEPVVRLVRLAPTTPLAYPRDVFYLPEFCSERTFKLGQVSRAYLERDWESMSLHDITRDGAGVESAREWDERMERGPALDGKQRPRELPPVKPLLDYPCEDDIGLSLICEKITTGEAINVTTGCLLRMSWYALDLVKANAKWRKLVDESDDRCAELEEKLRVATDELRAVNRDLTDDDRRRVLALQAKSPSPKRGDIIQLKVARGQWEMARVTLVDSNDLHFVTADDNGGSRPLADEGTAWMLDAHNAPGNYDGRQIENLAVAQFNRASEEWQRGARERGRQQREQPFVPNYPNGQDVVDKLADEERERRAARVKPDATAKAAEKERKKVEKQGERAARKAAGSRSVSTPVSRAAAAAMTVTSERVGPPIETAFVDDGSFKVTRTPDGATEVRDNNGKTTRITVHQKNLAEAKMLGIPVHVLMSRKLDAQRAVELAAAGLGLDGMPLTGSAAASSAARDVEPESEPDVDELEVASDRELERLGKRRVDGKVVDVALAGDPWNESGDPWNEAVTDALASSPNVDDVEDESWMDQ